MKKIVKIQGELDKKGSTANKLALMAAKAGSIFELEIEPNRYYYFKGEEIISVKNPDNAVL